MNYKVCEVYYDNIYYDIIFCISNIEIKYYLEIGYLKFFFKIFSNVMYIILNDELIYYLNF